MTSTGTKSSPETVAKAKGMAYTRDILRYFASWQPSWCVQTGRHPGAEHLSSTHVAPREIRLAPFAPRWRRAERLLDVPTCCNKSAWTIFALKIEMNWWKCTLAINIGRYWENPSTCRIDRCAARTHQIRAWLHHTYHNVQLLSSNLDKLITQLSRQGTPHTCNWQGYTLHM